MSLARPNWTQSVLTLAVVLTLLVITFMSVPAAFAAGGAQNHTPGQPQIGTQGVSRTTGDIMAEEARQPVPSGKIELRPEHEMPDRSGLPQNPASPHVASIPPMPADRLIYRRVSPTSKGAPIVPFTPQTVGVNFTAATLAGTNSTSSFPPDNDGAVGPTQYVIAVNGRIVSFNKTTGVADGVLNATTNSFFSTVRNASGTSDPMCRYDRLSNRWFLTIINVATNDNRWLLAVSDAASNGVISAGTVWTYYFFVPATIAPVPTNSTTMFSDYPTLGIDANALYVGVDEFAGSGQPFQQCDAFVIRKSSVLSGGPIVVTAFRALMSSPAVGGNYSGPFAPRGVDNFDPAATEGYLIGTDGNSFGTMWIERIANPGGTPTISADSVTLPAEDAVSRGSMHPGNTGGYWGYLDCLDDRFYQATMRNHQLWTVHNIAMDNTGVSEGTFTGDARWGARWFQVNVPVPGHSSIVQSGTVFTASANNDSLQKNYFIPSLNVNGQGHVAMGFTTAGNTAFVNASTVGRLVGDPLGTMETPVQLTTNTANTYNPASDPGGSTAGRPRRWGDYTQTMVDPLDDMSMWTVQQFVDANNSYGCRVARLIAPPPATPSAMADVVVGQPAVSVTLTGLSASGSGFFDPGADLPSPARPFTHLSAAVSNGAASGTPPTVVSATYVNATTVTVVLNTSSATANLVGQQYTITVTNPDGQTASGAVVHVVSTTITASAGANGSISPSGAVSVPFGTDQTFLVTANSCFSIGSVVVDGSPVGAVSSYTFHNVTTNHTISASFVAGLTSAVTGLTASQVKLGNGSSGTTGVTVSYAVPLGSSSVEVWRKGFGSYPLYAASPGTGSAPALPVSYPPAGWTLTGVSASGQVDAPGARDYWYYVAYGKDGCGDASPVSAMVGGVLDYHLGDFSDGVTPGQGDNTVNTADASLLGSHYGASGAGLAGFEYLDVGPTTDNSTNGRPLSDGVVDFEDLVMVALNYTPHVSSPGKTPLAVANAGSVNVVSAGAPILGKAGDAFDVPLALAGNGELQAISLSLAWDAHVVSPASVIPGELVTSQGGVVLSPGPGRADATLLGVGSQGIVGQGEVARVRFQILRSGDPGISISKVIGRDALNRTVAVTVQNGAGGGVAVGGTVLYPSIPNPARGTSMLHYSLAKSGTVDLAIFSVDGRLVRSLAHQEQGAGNHEFMWDGTDDHGSPIPSGIFYIRLDAAGVQRTRVLSMVR